MENLGSNADDDSKWRAAFSRIFLEWHLALADCIFSSSNME